MLASDAYELLDFGAGRKLERFGPYVLDRPSPAAEGVSQKYPDRWARASARFERQGENTGTWDVRQEIEPTWPVRLGDVTLELKLTDFGHLGIFPEQADNWAWIHEQVQRGGRPKVLNLFAYTGGSTLVAAAAGAEVVHVDAASNVVTWARRNAEASGLAAAPIRWITEDAAKFVRRELKRGQAYDAVLLDPPAYGHGPSGQRWKLAEQLADLLADCFELCRESVQFMLLSCHSGELATAEGLGRFIRSGRVGTPNLTLSAHEMQLIAADGGRLPAGAAVRWSRQ